MQEQFLNLGNHAINWANVNRISKEANMLNIYLIGEDKPLQFSSGSPEGQTLQEWIKSRSSLSEHLATVEARAIFNQ